MTVSELKERCETLNINNLKRRCEELIEQGYGNAEVFYYKDFFYSPPDLALFKPNQYHANTFFGKEFPSNSKEFVLIDEDSD